MNYFIRQLFSGIVRSKSAHALNFIGLSIAFACFAVIVMQVRYELRFDKHFHNSENLYQFQAYSPWANVYASHLSRPLAENLAELSPYIEASAFACPPNLDQSIYVVDKGPLTSVEMNFQLISDSLCQVFGLDIVEGSLQDFGAGNKAIISQQAAKALFGNESPIGKMIDNFSSPKQREIVAVHKDMPRNSSIINGVLGNFGEVDEGDWGNWNNLIYLLVTDANRLPEVETLTGEFYKSRYDKTPFEIDRIVRLTQLTDFHFMPMNQTQNQGTRTGVYTLLGIGVLILGIAVINFINFSMATVPMRIRSINTRKVLGSTTRGLRMKQIAESVCITLLAAAFSLVLIVLLSNTSFVQLVKADINLANNLGSIMILFVSAFLIGVVASLYPAWYSTSFSPALMLKGSFGLSVKGRKLRTALVGFQYCISIILIIAALFIRYQHQYMRFHDIGIDKENILTVTLTSKMANERSSIHARLESDPRIADLTYSYGSLIDMSSMGWGQQYKGQTVLFDVYPVEANFAHFMGLKVLEGEMFTEEDKTRAGSAYMFNKATQHKYDLEVGDLLENTVILGIFEDFHHRSLSKQIEPLGLYLLSNTGWKDSFKVDQMYIKLATPDMTAALEDIRKVLLEADPDAANVLKIQFMDEAVENLYTQERALFGLIFSFSLLAVLISTVGVFGLIMFETQYRKKEIAVRKVLGSTMEQILMLFNKHYVRIVLICYVISIPIAWYVVKEWQRPYAFKAPFSLWIFLTSLLIVMLITIATVTLQSYRTAAANPIRSLGGD